MRQEAVVEEKMGLSLSSWLPLLRCPSDGHELAAVANGMALECNKCRARYPVEDGIVRFLGGGGAPMPQAREARSRDAGSAEYDAQMTDLRNRIEIPPSVALVAPTTGDVLLELGAGTGRFTEKLAANVGRMVAVDLSFESLRRLRARLPEEVRGRVLAVQADVCAPGAAPGAFTKVVSFQVLEHVPTPELRARAIHGAQVALARGGKLVMSVYNWGLYKRVLAFRGYGDNTAREGYHSGGDIYFFNFRARELRALLQAEGLSEVRVRPLQLHVPGVDLIGEAAVPLNHLVTRIAWPGSTALSHLLLASATKP